MAQRRPRRLTGILTALALVLGLWSGFGPAERASAVTQAEIDAMQAKLDGMAEQMDALEAQLAAVAANKAQALEQKRLLDDQIALLNSQIAQTEAVIAQYDLLIAEKEGEIADIEAQEEAQYQLFCRQVRSMEEQGSVSYLSILFDCADFSELLDRAMMVSEIMEYNNDIIDLLLATREELEDAREELEEEQEAQQVLRDSQIETQEELEAQQAAAAALVEAIKSEESGYEAAYAAVEAEEEAIQAEIVRMTDALKAQEAAAAAAAAGGYIWPVNSRAITSKFGPRNTGIPGASTNHKGVDIGGVGYTSQVFAAKAGTVIISVRSSSYGEYVSIAHPDGTSTLYAHMSSRLVTAGDVVEQGDVIGITGSTGISSGPHLHFEITENGRRVDPLNYLTGYYLA